MKKREPRPEPRDDAPGIPLLIRALAAIVARQAREQKAVVQSPPSESQQKAA